MQNVEMHIVVGHSNYLHKFATDDNISTFTLLNNAVLQKWRLVLIISAAAIFSELL